MNQQAIEQIVDEVTAEILQTRQTVPIGVSARHIHLKQEHVEHLFGMGAQLTELRDEQIKERVCPVDAVIVGIIDASEES